jgi:hypothetical protein
VSGMQAQRQASSCWQGGRAPASVPTRLGISPGKRACACWTQPREERVGRASSTGGTSTSTLAQPEAAHAQVLGQDVLGQRVGALAHQLNQGSVSQFVFECIGRRSKRDGLDAGSHAGVEPAIFAGLGRGAVRFDIQAKLHRCAQQVGRQAGGRAQPNGARRRSSAMGSTARGTARSTLRRCVWSGRALASSAGLVL